MSLIHFPLIFLHLGTIVCGILLLKVYHAQDILTLLGLNSMSNVFCFSLLASVNFSNHHFSELTPTSNTFRNHATNINVSHFLNFGTVKIKWAT